MVKRAPWHMTVRNGAVAGGGDHPANGSISATGMALGASIVRRKAGVRGEHERKARQVERVSAMTGIDRRPDPELPEGCDICR